jgi:hypothetical protein
LAGDYVKGVTILSELFVSTRDPTHIYNQGRCFEQNARYVEAISRFQEYLRVGKNESAESRNEATKHIADCKGLLSQESAPPAIEPSRSPAGASEGVAGANASPSPSSLVAPSSAPSPTSVASVSQTEAPKPSQQAGSSLRAAGVVTVAVGGAALAAGILLNLKVNGLANDYQTYNGYTDQKESQRKSYETWGWVSYGVGAACVATGATLYSLGLRANRDVSHSVAVLPARDGAIFVVKGSL